MAIPRLSQNGLRPCRLLSGTVRIPIIWLARGASSYPMYAPGWRRNDLIRRHQPERRFRRSAKASTRAEVARFGRNFVFTVSTNALDRCCDSSPGQDGSGGLEESDTAANQVPLVAISRSMWLQPHEKNPSRR